MKSKLVVFSTFAILAGTALADAGNYPEPYLYNSDGPGLTRTEVMAAAEQAPRGGTMNVALSEFPSPTTSTSSLTRAEVIAEWKEAKKLGLLQIGEGDNNVATPEQNQRIALVGQQVAETVHIAGR